MAIDELTSLSSEEKRKLLKALFVSLEPQDKIDFIQDIIENIKINSEIEPKLVVYGRRIKDGYIQVIKDMIYRLGHEEYNIQKHLQVCLLIEGAPLFGITIPEEVKKDYEKVKELSL